MQFSENSIGEQHRRTGIVEPCCPYSSFFAVGVVRTGRRDSKRSAQSPALTTASSSPGHETAGIHFFPRFVVRGLLIGVEMRRFGAAKVRFLRFTHSVLRLWKSRRFQIFSTVTSQPLDVGIPVPSVSPPISLHVGGPYGTKIIPSGTFPPSQTNSADPNSVLTFTASPSLRPRSAMSSG